MAVRASLHGNGSVRGEGDQGEQGREQDVSGDDKNEDGHGMGFRGLAEDEPGGFDA